MTTLERGYHFRNAALIAEQRRFRSRLRDRARILGLLRLDIRHRRDDPGRTAGPAEAPAGHRIGLRHGMDDDRAIVEIRAGIDDVAVRLVGPEDLRSEEHTSELQSLMRISYA